MDVTLCTRNGEIRLENALIDIDGDAEVAEKVVSVGIISLKGKSILFN